MKDGYPKLIGVAVARRGCHLLLSDGSEACVNVTGKQIDAHLSRHSLPTLAEFCRLRNVAVLGDSIYVGAEKWDRLMRRLRESEVVQRLEVDQPGLAVALAVTHAQACDLPLRIYECFYRGCIYLYYPFNFQPEQDAPGWYRVALDLPGEWELQGRMQIGGGAVEVELVHCREQYIAELAVEPDSGGVK